MAPDRVNATETSIEILSTLARLERVGVTTVANEVGGSKANVHKHLATLEANGFVRRTGDGYALGYRFLSFATDAKESDPTYREGRPQLAKLADISGGTVTLVVRDGLDGVYLHVVPAMTQPATAPAEGDRGPLHRLAGGLAILSCYGSDRRRTTLRDLVDSESRVDELMDRLETVSQRGTVIKGGGPDEPREIAAPMTDGDDRPVGAVGFWEPTAGEDRSRVETDLRKLVRNTATTVSNRLSLMD